ncbi:chorismate mutase [Candidatus Nanopelagicales bacterium]|jgi:chorismate mutase|nr:chorismate mutase [Candidatus Nanopelagicales bacterium]
MADIRMCGIRGATCLENDDASEMFAAVGELLGEMLGRNSVSPQDVVSVILTCTPDLTSAFPAAGARVFGLVDTPLMCAQEMNVDGALAKVVRVLAHVETTTPRSEIQHVYLRGAEVLRQDLQQEPPA